MGSRPHFHSLGNVHVLSDSLHVHVHERKKTVCGNGKNIRKDLTEPDAIVL